MKTITITLSVTVPEGVEVAIETATQTSETPALLPEPDVHITDDALPVKRGDAVAWSDEEDDILRDATLSHADCAELLGRTYNSVASRRYTLGIKTSDRVRLIREASRAMARWTEAEVDYVLDAIDPIAEPVADDFARVGNHLGRSMHAVRTKYSSVKRERAEA